MKRKTFNGGKWTEARFRGFITSVLRSGSRKWPPKYETLNSAKTRKAINPSSGRMAQLHECAICQQEFSAKDMQVDHIKPVVDPKTGFKNWDTFIDRLYCEASNLQAVCKLCHAKKTKQERKK